MRNFFLFILLSIVSTGCVTTHKGSLRTPEPVPQEVSDYYSYPELSSGAQYGSFKDKGGYTYVEVYVPLSLPDKEVFKQKHIRESFLYNTIRMDYRLPNVESGKKVPAIIVSPILGGNEVAEIFAKYFAKKGFATLLVHRRRPELRDVDEGKFNNFETHLRVSVLKLKQSMDWLQMQSAVDPDRIGTFGISYGSIMHANYMAIDKRAKFNVIMLSGAPIGDVIVDSKDDGVQDLAKALKLSVLQDSGEEISDEEAKRILSGIIKTDPIKLGKHVDPSNVISYVAMFDKVVMTKHGKALWEALGKPELRMTPFGHYSSVLLVPFIQRQALKDFRKNL